MRILPDKEKYSRLQKNSRRVPVYGEASAGDLPPALLYREMFGDDEESFLFESGRGPEATARYTLMGASNARSLKIEKDKAFLQDRGSGKVLEMDALAGLDWLNFDAQVQEIDYIRHFWGGWVGFIGYEAAEIFENLPARKDDNLGVPDSYFIQVDRLVVFDHKKGLIRVIASREEQEGAGSFDGLAAEIDAIWTRIQKIQARYSRSPCSFASAPLEKSKPPGNGLKSNLSPQEYAQRVERAKIYIEEGDIYQANISQRFEAAVQTDPVELYRTLRSVNPSPFSGILKFRDFAIVSSSPERLVKVENDRVETRPIAGTRPRGLDPDKDRSLSSELLLNEKERAEHLMLVDLERNDLGRICQKGSVRVTDLMFLEQYSHVSHIVSNIEGKLMPDAGVKDILRAVFPGGTITGCPKIRSMEIIAELEPQCRGPYCGSMGYIGFSRFMDLNIIIRTFILKNGKACFNVGAGIVADSCPEKEYQETLDKAAALIQVLSGQENGRLP